MRIMRVMGKWCAAQICRLGTDCVCFYPHGLFVRRRKPLTAKTTQPYPAGALRKAATAAVFTSSLPNTVWQLHFSSRRPDSAGHTTAGIPHVLYSRSCLITRGGGARNKTYKTYKTYEQAVRRDILPTGTDCAIFYPHGLSWRRRDLIVFIVFIVL